MGFTREVLEVARIPGGPFKIFPTRRGEYQFRFENGRFYVEGSVWDNLPALLIQAKAELLYEYPGAEPFETFCRRIAEAFLRVGTEGMHLLPSRVDVAVDFQCEGFGIPERKDIATEARSLGFRARRAPKAPIRPSKGCVMQDSGYGFPRKHLSGSPVNKGVGLPIGGGSR